MTLIPWRTLTVPANNGCEKIIASSNYHTKVSKTKALPHIHKRKYKHVLEVDGSAENKKSKRQQNSRELSWHHDLLWTQSSNGKIYPPSISFITVAIVVGLFVRRSKSIRCVKALIKPVRRLSLLFDESHLFVYQLHHLVSKYYTQYANKSTKER